VCESDCESESVDNNDVKEGVSYQALKLALMRSCDVYLKKLSVVTIKSGKKGKLRAKKIKQAAEFANESTKNYALLCLTKALLFSSSTKLKTYLIDALLESDYWFYAFGEDQYAMRDGRVAINEQLSNVLFSHEHESETAPPMDGGRLSSPVFGDDLLKGVLETEDSLDRCHANQQATYELNRPKAIFWMLERVQQEWPEQQKTRFQADVKSLTEQLENKKVPDFNPSLLPSFT
jgi:hypothetical protein